MRLANILQGLKETQSAEKTASEKPAAAPVSTTKTALSNALHEALNTQPEKTAAAVPTPTPADDVMKIARDVAASEKEAALSEAKLLGSAMADAYVARIAEWSKTAAAMPAAPVPAPAQWTAPTATADFGKFANENPELVKQAHALGYQQARQDLEKEASDSYVQGFNETVTQIHKTAALEFCKGAVLMSRVLDAVPAQR